MNVLLTGATGFIGSALLSRLREIGIRVTTVGRVSTDRQLSEILSAKGPFDGCIHLATCYLPVHSEDRIPDMVDANVTIGVRMLEACVKLRCRWFVNAASYWQYASDGMPVNLYSAMKEAFQGVAAYYNVAYGLKVANLELTDTYGEKDPRGKLVNLWCEALNRENVMPMSQGMQEIELVHRDDVAEAFVSLIKMIDGDEDVAGNGETYFLPVEKTTVRGAASIFESATGGRLPILWGGRPERAREIKKIIHRGSPLPGWRQKISLKEGFSRVYSAFSGR